MSTTTIEDHNYTNFIWHRLNRIHCSINESLLVDERLCPLLFQFLIAICWVQQRSNWKCRPKMIDISCMKWANNFIRNCDRAVEQQKWAIASHIRKQKKLPCARIQNNWNYEQSHLFLKRSRRRKEINSSHWMLAECRLGINAMKSNWIEIVCVQCSTRCTSS